jgi:DNA-binding transcriptional LysR family regulator
MTLQQLRAFLAAADHGSFTAGAFALHIAQPSLSEHVRTLERELGVALFVRAGRRVELTEPGRALRRHARRAIASAEEGAQAVAAVRNVVAGTVTLGSFGTASYYLIADLIAEFRRRHPHVGVRMVGLNSADAADEVRAGRIEAALVVLPVDPTGLDLRPVATDPVLYVSSSLRRLSSPVTVERLCAARLILPHATHGLRDPMRRQLAERAQRAGLSLTPVVEVEDVWVALQLAALGVGDTVASAAIARHASLPRGLGSVGFAEPLIDTFAIATRRDVTVSPATRALVRIAEQLMRTSEVLSGPAID